MITRDAALSPTPSNTPEIYLSKLDDSDNNGIKDLTVINANAPIRIVGAGVST